MAEGTLAELRLADTRWLRFTAFTSLYFAQGIPIGLLTIAVPAWLAANGLATSEIASYIGVVSLPWGVKLVAGPFMDRFTFLAMGFRRPWVLVAQAGLTLTLLMLVTVEDPAQQLPLLLVIGFCVNAFAAVQDVAVDGMAIDLLPDDERGRANAFMAFGQVAGYSFFAAVSGRLLDAWGLWAAAAVGAATVGTVFLLVAASRERRGEKLMPWTRGSAAPRAALPAQSFGLIFRDLVRVLVLPMSILLTVCESLNRIADGVLLSFLPAFAVQGLGFDAAQYSEIRGMLGIVAAFLGVLAGPVIDRVGAKRVLLIGFAGGAVVRLGIALVADSLTHPTLAVTALLMADLFGQLVFVSFIALSMSLCWSKVAATQFAIYMSISNLVRSGGAGAFALVADDLTYVQDILLVAVLVGLAALLLTRFDLVAHRRRIEALERREVGSREGGVAQA